MLVAVGISVGSILWKLGYESRIDALLKPVVEAGHPIDLQGLDRWYRQLAGEVELDSLPIHVALRGLKWDNQFDAEGLPDGMFENLPNPGEPFSDTMVDAVSLLLKRNSKALSVLMSDEIERFHPVVDWTVNAGLPYESEIRRFRQGPRLLLNHGLDSIIRGDLHQCEAAVRSALKLTNVAMESPSLLVRMMARASHVRICQFVVWWIAYAPPGEEILERLIGDLEVANDAGSMSTCLIPLRAMGVDLFLRPISEAAKVANEIYVGPSSLTPGASDRWIRLHRAVSGHQSLARFLERISEYEEILEEPSWEVVLRLEELRNEIGDEERMSFVARLVDSVVTRPFENSARLSFSIQRMLRVARLAVMTTRYRVLHQRTPRTLEELGDTSDARLDPYSGAPFRVEETDEGFRILGGLVMRDPETGRQVLKSPDSTTTLVSVGSEINWFP